MPSRHYPDFDSPFHRAADAYHEGSIDMPELCKRAAKMRWHHVDTTGNDAFTGAERDYPQAGTSDEFNVATADQLLSHDEVMQVQAHLAATMEDRRP